MNWISVTEKLPETSREVLVYSNQYVDIAEYSEVIGYFINRAYSRVDVTHWMELPEHPETF